jgi:hypothetical protein
MTQTLSTNSWLIEARALARLAGPLIINNLSIAGMQFADAVMAGRLGAEALAAVAVGGSVWFLGFTVCLGLMMAISPITARLFGAGEMSLIGRYTRQGLWLAVALGLTLITLVQLFVEPVLTFLGIGVEFRQLTIGYVQAIIYGAPAICGFLAFRFTTEGIGFMRPIMYTSLLALVCNVFLNYVLIYGHFGLPAFGAVGCGMASAITMWLMLFMIGSIVYFHPTYAPLKIFERVAPVRIPILKEIVKLGMPIGITITAEAGLFSAVSILVGTLGASITAAHQIRGGQSVHERYDSAGNRHQPAPDGGGVSDCGWRTDWCGRRFTRIQGHENADGHQHVCLLGIRVPARLPGNNYVSCATLLYMGRVRARINCGGDLVDVAVFENFEGAAIYGANKGTVYLIDACAHCCLQRTCN